MAHNRPDEKTAGQADPVRACAAGDVGFAALVGDGTSPVRLTALDKRRQIIYCELSLLREVGELMLLHGTTVHNVDSVVEALRKAFRLWEATVPE